MHKHFSISGLFGDHVVKNIRGKKDMGFGDLKAKAGQQALNAYLADKSYIEGLVFFKEIKRFLCGENKQCN